MIWSDILGLKQKCKHSQVPLDVDIYYCPDCGELIENQWYIVRCACCGVKQLAIVKNDNVIPAENFCHNCGGRDYVVERIDKINCININYAVLLRVVVNPEIKEYTQSWEEITKTIADRPKLLR